LQLFLYKENYQGIKKTAEAIFLIYFSVLLPDFAGFNGTESGGNARDTYCP